MEQYGTYVQQLDCSVNHWLDTLKSGTNVDVALNSHVLSPAETQRTLNILNILNMDEHG